MRIFLACSEIERVILEAPELAPHYRIVLERRGSLDSLVVEAELVEDVRDEALREVLRRRVCERLEVALLIGTGVSLLPPGALPRSEGKAVRVVDRRAV